MSAYAGTSRFTTANKHERAQLAENVR
jgi:hypothetical protein